MGVKDADLRVSAVAAPVRAQLVEALRRAILQFELRPGDRLIEREICERAGVSRTSVREALRQLESEGLIAIVPNKGPVVASVTSEEARQIYELRAELEGFAGRKFAAEASAGEIAALRRAATAFRKSVAAREPKQLLFSKARFYDLLIAGARNEALEAALRNLHDRVTLLRATSMSQPGRVQQSVAELQAIVAAIARRDPAGAERACRRHVEKAAAVALGLLAARDAPGGRNAKRNRAV